MDTFRDWEESNQNQPVLVRSPDVIVNVAD